MKATIARATQIAHARGHNYLGTEHMILALLDDPRGIAGGVMHQLGYAAAIREAVVSAIGSDGYSEPSR
jgi:ATP-dependent Clp protease ATP-binding subunit ClpC